jgi:hypothetical protein
MEKQTCVCYPQFPRSKLTHSGSGIFDKPSKASDKPRGASGGDKVALGVVILFFAGLAYLTIFVLIPSSQKMQFEKEQVRLASIQGPQVLLEVLEELKRMRVALERIAPV